ncbi:MAG: tRNA epoxyqueuosine(34) reductase QueG [Myxococcota bacterium]
MKELALEVGFDLVGITSPDAQSSFERYSAQMTAGYGAEMSWLYERPELRRDVRTVHSETRSVIVLAVSYASDTPGYLEAPPAADEGWIARYAQGRDYHHDVRKMAIRLAKAMSEEPSLGGESSAHRVFVDTGPVLEKAFAQRAGLGWMGKNTLLLNRGLGSWVFLGVILTPLELASDAPGTDHCGSCTRCLDACPTGAFPEPYVLDARACIATWTIESAEPSAVIEAESLGQHVFGCDICQEVCPWNRGVPEGRLATLLPREENLRPKLETLAGLDEESFRARFPRSAVRRTSAEKMAEVVEIIRTRGAVVSDEPSEP